MSHGRKNDTNDKSYTVAVLGKLANQLPKAQVDQVVEYIRAVSSPVVPILIYLEMSNAHKESWELQIKLIEEGINNPPPWPEGIVWSPVLDAWLDEHDAKLMIAPHGSVSTNEAGELEIDQIGQLALFSLDTPGEQGQPQVPTGIRNQWAYAQGQFDAMLERRTGLSVGEDAAEKLQDHLKRTVAERDKKRALGYASSQSDNRKAYQDGKHEAYLAEVRTDYLSGYLSAWPSPPILPGEGGDTAHGY